VHLRHQALILGLALLPLTGCVRLLQSILAPQQSAISAAQGAADNAVQSVNSAMASPAKELESINSEVGRLLGGDGADKGELERLQAMLDKRIEAFDAGPAAQADLERLQPWHPRSPPPAHAHTGDAFALGSQTIIRGLPASSLIADGIAAAELPGAIDLTPIRPRGPLNAQP
jgi:hypothetical protein